MSNFHKASTSIGNGSQEHKLMKFVLYTVQQVLMFFSLDRIEQLKSMLLINLKFGINLGNFQVSASYH